MTAPNEPHGSFERQAARRLAILNAAPSLDTLRALPGNRLLALRGARKGQYFIWINQQWRILLRLVGSGTVRCRNRGLPLAR